MRILILGGTNFLGRHTAAAALERGHKVTLFHRGQTNPGLFPGAEEILGDREHDLHLLAGRDWDVVIDVPGYLPRVVRASAQALVGHTKHYTFISTISVYDSLPEPGMDETAAVGELPEPSEDVQNYYGQLKALCEDEVRNAFPDSALIIRPGLIVGPFDPTDRFSYWPIRIAEGGDVLAPGDPDRQVQVIDARDLAAWIVDCAERGVTGTFNATGPATRMSMREMLEACRKGTGSDATFTWGDEAFLEAEGVGRPWMELPLWLPESSESTRGMLAVSIERALAAGLTFRPLAETARDTVAWHRASGSPELQAGLARERERELLAKWRGR